MSKFDSDLFSGLMSLYIHQNELMWSRMKVLLTIESAVLVAGYELRDIWLGPFIMFMGIVFIFIISVIYHRDGRYRDNVKEVLTNIVDDNFKIDNFNNVFLVRKYLGIFSGTMFFYMIVFIFLIINIALILLLIYKQL